MLENPTVSDTESDAFGSTIALRESAEPHRHRPIADEEAEVEVVEALVAHLGQPVISDSHKRERPRFLVVLTAGDHDEYGTQRDPALLTALAQGLRSEVAASLLHLENVWVDNEQHIVVALMTAKNSRELRTRVTSICDTLTNVPWTLADGTTHRVDLGAGYSRIADTITAEGAVDIASATAKSAQQGLTRRDLVCLGPQRTSRNWTVLPSRLRLPLQIVVVLCLSTVGPFLIMRGTYALGFDSATIFYVGVVVALAFTAILIWTESLHALTPMALPPTPTTAPPVATAIVAAYLPNEADTIVETLAHVLGQDYPGELQVILAYNSPVELPVEEQLRQLVRTHPELEILKVADSTSKAQNVNAALQIARGEFIGVFDADHHPVPGSFTRAWHWIADGADVVQGHCVVRNGDESLIARAVSIEFEQIYAVSHPGRSSLHDFGIFGGSNGYWRATTLRRVRMRVDRLTEDIDASIRSILKGASIVSDPGLISRELAPITLSALWRQRMRWAQGWFQVSMRQLPAVMTSRSVTVRQRMGMFVLFAWREVYPWISPMIIGVLAFLWWRDGGLSWSSPLFLLTTLYTLAAGPIQILFAWRLSVPEIRARRWWFVWYLFIASPVYNEWKNLVARVAQMKELMGEHEWHVTPRGTMRAFVPSTANDSSPHAEGVAPHRQIVATPAMADGSL